MDGRRNCGGSPRGAVLSISNGEAHLTCCASVNLSHETKVHEAMFEKTLELLDDCARHRELSPDQAEKHAFLLQEMGLGFFW